MSTGDQSQYVRAKMAERGSNAQSKFMMDGFDRWAESTTPAREGQMEKVPAEPTGSSYGGAMTLSKAKRKLHKLEGLQELEGGVDVMGTINTAIDYARKVREFWDKASKFMEELEKDLKEEILANSVYNKDKGLVDTVNGFLQIMQGFKLYKTQIDAFSAGLKAIGLGKPHDGKLHGGADLTQLGKIAGQIISWVAWLHKAAKNLRTILKLPSLHPVGGKVIEVLEPVLKLIGASRKRSSSPCMKYCQCDSKKGSAAPMRIDYDEDFRPFTEEERSYMDVRRFGGRAMSVAQLAAMRGGPSEPVGLGGRKRGSAAPLEEMSSEKYEAMYGMTPEKKMAMGGRKRSARKVMVMEPMLGGAFQSCKPGWIDDGLLCRKPINCSGFPLKCEGGEVVPKKRVGGKKPSARGEIVKKVMREQGLSLPQASKYVKDNNMY